MDGTGIHPWQMSINFFGVLHFSFCVIFGHTSWQQLCFIATHFKRNWLTGLYTMPLMIHVWRIVTENCVWQKNLKCCAWHLILKHCAWRRISKHCARRPSDTRQMQLFKTLRLTPARHQPDVTFQNHAPDVLFCDHASDVQYESGYVDVTSGRSTDFLHDSKMKIYANRSEMLINGGLSNLQVQ